MRSYQQALKIILEGAAPAAAQIVSLDRARGQVAAAAIDAREDVPPFDNSAMDGFAVKSALVEQAAADRPVLLDVDGSTMAGDSPEAGGEGAWEIMTGAPVPAAYDAVIRIEDIKILDQNRHGRPTRISLHAAGFPGKNIRAAGTDFRPGDRVIEAGTVIAPHHIMALAAVGQDRISVTPPPAAAVISTGKELVDEMDRTLAPGQIRNCNAPYLMESLKTLGVPARNEGTIFDEPEKFEQKIRQILSTEARIILSSGAVSMGRHDFVPDGLRKTGAEILFHKAAIRPGKPILFARFPNGAYYFGLPGNPIAAAVGLRFFACPLMGKLQGLAPEQPLSARLSADFAKESPFRFFLKARSYQDRDGRRAVDILPGQESFKIKPMLAQNCWAVIPEDGMAMAAGSPVDIYPLYPGGGAGELL